MRDFQRQRVYDWENGFVTRFDGTNLPFSDIQPLVSYIWNAEKLKGIPKVKALHGNSRSLAEADRHVLWFPIKKKTRGYVILHEIAHAMNVDENMEWRGAIHGSEWLGLYIKILNTYLSIPLLEIINSANNYNLHYDMDVTPIKV